MNLDKLQEKVIAIARKNTPSDHVPFAFEKRIMARLADASIPDGWILWGRALWRAAIPCLLLVLFVSVWSSASVNADDVGAAELAAQQQIRGCDAVYVALARQRGAVLITLDRQQRDRVPPDVVARTPAQELAEMAC